MKVITHRVDYKYGDTWHIKPIFDVHIGAAACDMRAFRAYLADSDEQTLFIGGGDLMDCVISRDVRRYRKTLDATESDAIISDQIDMAFKELEPYKDRIIGLALGNHEDDAIKRCAVNPVKILCKMLDVPYLGLSGLVRLIFREKDKGGRGRMVVIRYHHGWGGGSRTQGADLTKFSKDTTYWPADVFLFGHVHRKQTDVIPRIGLVGETMVSKPMVVCICGTFLKTYTRGDSPTYSEVKGYPPISTGGVVVDIKPTRDWVKIKAYLD